MVGAEERRSVTDRGRSVDYGPRHPGQDGVKMPKRTHCGAYNPMMSIKQIAANRQNARYRTVR